MAMDSRQLSKKAYLMIDRKASSNSLIQGLSGIAGFPLTLAVDGAVVLTHYTPLLNEIRALYDRNPVNEDVLMPIIKGASNEILFDLVADKALGSIPLVGIYFNAICAKTMTWRLGILFSMMASRGENMLEDDVKNTMKLIRHVFPQSETFKFKKPNYISFEKLLTSVHENSESVYQDKVESALKMFD